MNGRLILKAVIQGPLAIGGQRPEAAVPRPSPHQSMIAAKQKSVAAIRMTAGVAWACRFLYPPIKRRVETMNDRETAKGRACRHAPIVCVRLLLSGALLALLSLSLSGCSAFGPGTIARDRFDYSAAVAASWQRQLLLNMVKSRYADTPIFLDVASIVNQYALATEVNLSGGLSSGIAGDAVALGARGRYEDRPTITYNPVTGEQFTRSILTPLPPASIFSLIQAGWPVDFVFRLAVRAVNGIYGSGGERSIGRPADPEYYLLIEAMREIQIAGGMGIRITRRPDAQSTVLLFRSGRSLEVADQIEFVRNTLGLARNSRSYTLAFGDVASSDKEIAILTRSMLEIVSNIASTIEVPQQHVTERRTYPTIVERIDEDTLLEPLIRVYSSTTEPDDAFVSVTYRDHWFWVDDRDLSSKRMFTFLLFMFSLAETGQAPMSPVVTINAGG